MTDIRQAEKACCTAEFCGFSCCSAHKIAGNFPLWLRCGRCGLLVGDRSRMHPAPDGEAGSMNRPERLDAIISAHAGKAGALLPVLHDVQQAFGCVDAAAEAAIAEALNLSRAEVHGVVSFYHDFTASADPRPCVEICRAEACQARGVEALVPAAEAAAGDRVALKTVYCLGLCSAGPAARVGDRVHARLDASRLAELVRSA